MILKLSCAFDGFPAVVAGVSSFVLRKCLPGSRLLLCANRNGFFFFIYLYFFISNFGRRKRCPLSILCCFFLWRTEFFSWFAAPSAELSFRATSSCRQSYLFIHSLIWLDLFFCLFIDLFWRNGHYQWKGGCFRFNLGIHIHKTSLSNCRPLHSSNKILKLCKQAVWRGLH